MNGLDNSQFSLYNEVTDFLCHGEKYDSIPACIIRKAEKPQLDNKNKGKNLIIDFERQSIIGQKCIF